MVALWRAGRLRTFTYVAAGAEGRGMRYERKQLEPGEPRRLPGRPY